MILCTESIFTHHFCILSFSAQSFAPILFYHPAFSLSISFVFLNRFLIFFVSFQQIPSGGFVYNYKLSCRNVFALLVNKKDRSSGLFISWAEVDSNHRSNLQQIYSLSPLATRESALTRFDYITSILISQQKI